MLSGADQYRTDDLLIANEAAASVGHGISDLLVAPTHSIKGAGQLAPYSSASHAVVQREGGGL